MSRRPAQRSGPGFFGLSCLGCGLVAAAGVAGLAVLGVVMALVVGPRVREAGPKDTTAQVGEPTRKAATKTELEQLLDAHRANEADARRRYADKPLTVTGVVKSFDPHTRPEQGGFVTMDQVEGVKVVVANFKPGNADQAKALPVGERATIRGKYGNGSMMKEGFVLILSHCEVVPGP